MSKDALAPTARTVDRRGFRLETTESSVDDVNSDPQ